MGFKKSQAYPDLYYIVVGEDLLILMLYVDDLFIRGAERLVEGCKKDLASKFEMKDIGFMHYFLGLEEWQDDRHIFLGQGKFTVDILSRFHMGDCRPMSTPMITKWKNPNPHLFQPMMTTFILNHSLKLLKSCKNM